MNVALSRALKIVTVAAVDHAVICVWIAWSFEG